MKNINLRWPLTAHLFVVGGAVALAGAIAMAQNPNTNDSKAAPRKAPDENRPATRRDAGAPADARDGAKDAARREENRRRGYMLGFDVEAQGDQGLRINRLEDNGVAAQAGLRQNDRIISIDGRPFARPRQLQAYLGGQAGRQIPIVIERDGKQYTVQFVPPAVQDDSAWLGAYLEEGDANNKGARITQVYPASPAARAGLQSGDIVTKIADQNIDDSGDLVATVQGMEPRARVDFVVLRNDQPTTIPVVLGSRDAFVYRSEYRGPTNDQGQNQGQNQGSQNNRGGEFDDIPPYAMQLEHDRRNGEQHERIEQEIRLLREEIAKLREELKRK